jgi:hypothetical protein
MYEHLMHRCLMTETDRQKFARLATARVNKALKALRLVGNLSNRSNYSYTTEDVERIFRALNSELRACRQRFESESANSDGAFRLD